jgi:hypothetical protein
MARLAGLLVLALCASSAMAATMCLSGYSASGCAGSPNTICDEITSGQCF